MNALLSSDFSPNDQGIEILVDMAREGTVDPWNVDLIVVAEQYLQRVNPASQDISNDTDGSKLRLTGKTLLYLAILLRMKSDLLAGFDPFRPEIEDADFADMDYEEDDAFFESNSMAQEAAERFKQAMRRRVGSLEDAIARRTSAKQARIRPVTLDDLIRELKKLEGMEEERALRQQLKSSEKRRRVRDFSQLSTEDITQLAHEEFQEDMVNEIKGLLETHLPVESDMKMSLTDLVDLSGHPPVICFLSLLFLEARQEVEVSQERFYSDELQIAWDLSDEAVLEQARRTVEENSAL